MRSPVVENETMDEMEHENARLGDHEQSNAGKGMHSLALHGPATAAKPCVLADGSPPGTHLGHVWAMSGRNLELPDEEPLPRAGAEQLACWGAALLSSAAPRPCPCPRASRLLSNFVCGHGLLLGRAWQACCEAAVAPCLAQGRLLAYGCL